jgi:hypothetical protein
MEKTLRNMIIRPLPEERQDTTGATAGNDTKEAGGDCEQNQRTVVGSQHKGAAAEVLVTVGTQRLHLYQPPMELHIRGEIHYNLRPPKREGSADA